MSRSTLLALAAWLCLFRCSKGDVPSGSRDLSANEPALAPASASAPPSATATASASATGSATTILSAPAAPSTKPAPTCGDKPLPACPLHAWMKANTAPALNAQDFGALVVAFEKIVGFGPPAYTHWRSIARDGADAARVEQLDAVKAACRACHNQYRNRYKMEMRDRPI